jgi:hypothetical protein
LAGDHPPGPDPSMGGPNGGSGAYAIRALPELCLGIVSGRLGDVAIEFRSANNDHDHLTALATDFARRPVAVIVGTAASKADTPDEVTNELSVAQSPLNSRRFSNLISLLFRLHRCRQVR